MGTTREASASSIFESISAFKIKPDVGLYEPAPHLPEKSYASSNWEGGNLLQIAQGLKLTYKKNDPTWPSIFYRGKAMI